MLLAYLMLYKVPNSILGPFHPVGGVHSHPRSNLKQPLQAQIDFQSHFRGLNWIQGVPIPLDANFYAFSTKLILLPIFHIFSNTYIIKFLHLSPFYLQYHMSEPHIDGRNGFSAENDLRQVIFTPFDAKICEKRQTEKCSDTWASL